MMTTMELKKFLTGCHIFIQCNIAIFFLVSVYFLSQYGLNSIVSITFISLFTVITTYSFEYLRQYFLEKKREPFRNKLFIYTPYVNEKNTSLVLSLTLLKHIFLVSILIYLNYSMVNILTESHEKVVNNSSQNTTNLDKMITNYD